MLQMEFLKLLILNPPKNKKYTLGRLYTRMLNPPKNKKYTIGRLYTRMSPIDSCKINAKLSICLEKKFAVHTKSKLVQILISFLTLLT